MPEERTLPALTHRQRLNEVFVDATPDGGYALRILEAFRRRCDVEWAVEGLTNGRKSIYTVMNDSQRARAAELDRAIALLRSAADMG